MRTFLHDTEATFEQNADGLYVARSQVITDEFLTDLKNERAATSHVQAGNYHKAASVPTFVWELWMREGRDPQNATPRQIVQWLRDADLHAFIATERRL